MFAVFQHHIHGYPTFSHRGDILDLDCYYPMRVGAAYHISLHKIRIFMKRHLKTIQYLRVLCIAEVQKFSSSRRRIIGHNSTNILHDPCLSLLPYPLTHLSCTVARTTYHRQNAHRMSICSFVCFSVHVLLPLSPVSGCVRASVYLQENNPCV